MQRIKTPRLTSSPAKQGVRLVNITITVVSVLLVVFFVGWLGLQLKPAPFPAYPQVASTLEAVPLPQNLPAPVKRFYDKIYGDEIPVVNTAVVTGRATMRIKGITFPARFRFTHRAGLDYRHYIEATFFGFPIMRVNETYLNGESRLELPFGVTEGEPKVNQAANLGLWSEGIWFPTIFLTDPRVRWEPVDDVTALLVVPFSESSERYVVRFDPYTGLIRMFESMRYKEADSLEKTLWLNEVLEWGTIDGNLLPVRAALTWFDEGSPWAVFTVEEVIYNEDVSDYI